MIANEVSHQNMELLFSQEELYLNAIHLDFQITSSLKKLNKVDRRSKKMELFLENIESKKVGADKSRMTWGSRKLRVEKDDG